MALKVYQIDETNYTFTELSVGTFDEAVVLSGRPGGSAVVKKVFLRNDDATKWYSDIIITPKTTIGGEITGTNLRIKLLSGDTKPTDSDWEGAEVNDEASLESPLDGGPRNTRIPELGSAAGADRRYHPFWIWVKASPSLPIDNDAFFVLHCSYTENVV